MGEAETVWNPEWRKLYAREDRGLRHQDGFELVLAELALLRIDKCAEYGEDRYDSSRWTVEEELWMIFSDVYRKFIRMRQQVARGDSEGMRESCRDIANYGAMGVQLIDQRKREQSV